MAQLSFDEFINKWTGRGIDFDGYYGDQCMDLMHQYHVEVLGITDGRTLAKPTAKEVFTQFDSVFNNALFERIVNTPDNVPQKGDIVIWGEPYGIYVKDGQPAYAGHIAIFLDGDVNQFRSFDQNWPTGAKCGLVQHNYSGVLGWLRFRGSVEQKTVEQVQQELQTQIEATSSCQTQLKTAIEQANLHLTKVQSLQETLDVTKGELEETKKKYDDKCNEVISLKAEITKTHEEDKNYAVQALEAEHKANEKQEALSVIADELGVQYNPQDDKKLVQEILQRVADERNKAAGDPSKLQAVIKHLTQIGINQYLELRGKTPIDTNDPEFDEKVKMYLDDLANELLAAASTTIKKTPVTETIQKPRRNIFSYLYTFIGLFVAKK